MVKQPSTLPPPRSGLPAYPFSPKFPTVSKRIALFSLKNIPFNVHADSSQETGRSWFGKSVSRAAVQPLFESSADPPMPQVCDILHMPSPAYKPTSRIRGEDWPS
jgi:hypothetical protein